MTYRINVAEAKGRNWDNSDYSYSHYFAVKVDCEDTMQRMLNDFYTFYPAPQYNVTATKRTTVTTKVDLV